MNRVTQFVYDEWQWILLYIMIGVVMYWTAIVVKPTFDLAEQAKQEAEFNKQQIQTGLEQNKAIIDNQDNNTALLVELFERQNKLLSNQIVLVSKLTNATQTLNISNSDINSHIETIIVQSDQIKQMVSFFRENFDTAYLGNETVERLRSKEILGNVTKINEGIRELVSEITELKGIANITNSTK